jgi:O-acetyl-ADP-ribose deacetylase (regulator of RNase III)
MQPPAHDQLVADLKTLRERGLTRLRGTRLAALDAAATVYGEGGPTSAEQVPSEVFRPAAVEELLRRAIIELGGGNLSAAAEYTFGLATGTRDWPVGERRKKAAMIYGVSTERFRKHHEHLIVDQTAEAILRLCISSEVRRQPSPSRLPRTPAVHNLGPVTLDFMPVEMITGIDVIVSSENVYLEASKIFRNSLSAALRRACAESTEAGQVIDDVIQRELTQWLRAHGRLGLPVAPGTVAATDAGRLREAGVRRIYHSAVAVPRAGGSEYEIAPETVARAVNNVFRLAEQERSQFEPPLRSIAFPLFGAGRGGLEPTESMSWLWAAVERELHDSVPRRWDLHIITQSPRDAQAVFHHFGQDQAS